MAVSFVDIIKDGSCQFDMICFFMIFYDRKYLLWKIEYICCTLHRWIN
ncbi:hypothetical protein COPEUT_01147 [Coprococcus eutactus ATCC 27759]|nr:hypothetical protein COPEUT_01147 [Coprococcus eutactus ATCC 27759]